MKNKKLKKALSVFLSVLMLVSCWVWVAPTDAEAAGSYYVRVYLNIYDGANSDGYGNAYTVVTDPNSEYYGKPNNYSWKTNAGYYGNINMAGFTLFYDNDTKYVTYDLAADLVAATTTLGNNWTSMDDLTLENFANCENKIEKVYGFTVSTIPSSLFWINDENNAVNGETSFGFYKITVAKDDQSEEHILWEGLSGSESYMYNYYGTITPNGIITPWNDWPDAKSKTFYKEYTTSFSDIWFTEQIATSVVFDNGTTINYTIPKIDADDGGSYYTRSAKVYDQYGGEMNVTPTSYYVTDANGNVLNNNSIYYSGGKLYVKRELQKLYPATTSNTFYLVAEYNGIKGSIQFNLTNPTYTVDYTNRNGEVLGGYTVTKVYGEVVELATELSFYSEKVINDDGTHTVYAFPSTVTVTGDMTVSPVGTTSAHSDSAEDTDHKCDVCGAENITSHNWVAGDIISSPDCNNDGSQAYNCSDCGATKTETITSEGHKYAMTDLGDGTLLNPDDGECNHIRTEKEYITNIAENEKNNTHSLKCECGEILSTEACTFTTNTVDSTCRAEGYTTYCCTVCGYGFMADFTEMTVHNYGDWATEKGSCIKVMTKTRYCLNKDCYAQETVEVYENGKPVYGTHTLVIVNGQAATCLKDGHSDYTRCIVCNEVTESEVIPATGHVDSNNNGNCDVCSGLMNPSGHCSCMCHGDTFFEKLLFRLVNFFWKLFKINANCECGAKHW